MAIRSWEFTTGPAPREMPAAALDAAAWILALTWPSSTSNSYKSFSLHAINQSLHMFDYSLLRVLPLSGFTFGLSKLAKGEAFFSPFFSSGLGAGGGSSLALASRVLVLDASTLNMEQKKA